MKTPSLLAELAWRELLHDQTPGLAERLSRGPLSGYVGFDPTATSLQLGNLVPVMLLAHLQRAGGKPIVVMGGGTGLIGDPSGKSAERPLLSPDDVAFNVESQRRQFARFLDFEAGPARAEIIDNADWLSELQLVPFLRDIGKHFTVALMLQKESVRSRMDSGISFTEFTYMLLQAYDFLHLYQHHGCELQLGGSDQWGNITAGIELIRRIAGGEAHGLSAPLVTTTTGKKFGKSEGGAIWLDPALTSPYQFYQFWMNVDDRDVERFLKMFTFLSREAIADLMEAHTGSPGARVPQKTLGHDVTARVHGAEAARSAAEAAEVLFGELDPRRATVETWEALRRELPHVELELGQPMSTIDVVTAVGLAKSKSEARRLLSQGGVTLNGGSLSADGSIGPSDLLHNRYAWLRRGKKTDAIVVSRSP